jgi:hypothetical protein
MRPAGVSGVGVLSIVVPSLKPKRPALVSEGESPNPMPVFKQVGRFWQATLAQNLARCNRKPAAFYAERRGRTKLMFAQKGSRPGGRKRGERLSSQADGPWRMRRGGPAGVRLSSHLRGSPACPRRPAPPYSGHGARTRRLRGQRLAASPAVDRRVGLVAAPAGCDPSRHSRCVRPGDGCHRPPFRLTACPRPTAFYCAAKRSVADGAFTARP